MGKTFDGSLVSPFVFVLEVVAGGAISIPVLNNQPLIEPSWDGDTVLVVSQTCKDFIRPSIDQTDKGNPFIFIILEANNVRIQYRRPGGREYRKSGRCVFSFLFFVRNKYTGSRSITIY